LSKRGILITGATGNVGREMVLAAMRAGLTATAAVRHATNIGGLPSDFPMVSLDFHNSETWAAALEGHDAVFLVRPPAIADVDRNINPFIDRAYASGVKHVVFLSVAGADRNRFVPHAKVEAHLAACGNGYSNLRPGFFAQNLQDAYLADIREDDRIILPAGRAEVNWIDVRDVAEVAALIFANPELHRGKSYSLTGPRAVNLDHVARLLSEATGRRIDYKAVSIARYVLHLHRRGLPKGAIVIQTILHALLRFGQGAKYDATLEQLLGRPARSIETYIRENAAVWKVKDLAQPAIQFEVEKRETRESTP
jgi:uncharacterized protein YbjT (DUF2867 family)